MFIKISKVRDVKTPLRATEGSAGYDLFVPNFTNKELEEKNLSKHLSDITPETFILLPNQGIVIPSGIHMNLDQETMFSGLGVSDVKAFKTLFLIDNKSGIASKNNVIVGANTVDEDYQGEIHLNVINVGKIPFYIPFGQKLVQGKFQLVMVPKIEEVNIDILYNETTDRGEGGFGSTGLH